jgi:thiosulfate/3-mercaptopyruvate sulfurtransferase
MTSPLISIDDLHRLLGTELLRIVDVRSQPGDPAIGRQWYSAGHIDGAIFLSLDDDLSSYPGPGRHPLPSVAAFGETLERAGIGPEHSVVIYDQIGGAIAARLWWMLEHVGHDNVRVLDGGWQAWEQAGFPTSQATPSLAAANWPSFKQLNPTLDRGQLAGLLGSVTVLDARAPERYAGIVEPLDAVAGHIPSSTSAPFAHNLENGTFKDPGVLRSQFAALGLDSAAGVVNSCGSGVTACHNILAMRLAGLGQGTLYPGSWSDWSSAGMPVATGHDPGEAPT